MKLKGYTVETIKDFCFTANFVMLNGSIMSHFFYGPVTIKLKAGNGIYWAEVDGKPILGVIKVVQSLLPRKSVTIVDYLNR